MILSKPRGSEEDAHRTVAAVETALAGSGLAAVAARPSGAHQYAVIAHRP